MKKRMLSWILSVCLIISAVPLSTATAFAETGVLLGDADGSGKVDLQDVYAMEAYIDGETPEGFNSENADVNKDGIVDQNDVSLVKEYLAGNIQLTDDLCTITFNTDGGGDISPVKVGRGYEVIQEIPSPAKKGHVFTGWIVESTGETFYQSNPVTQDLTVKATYEAMESTEEVYIDSFALTDQQPDLSFDITAAGMTAEQVKGALTLTVKDNSDPVELSVTDDGDGTFTVKAIEGFTPGASYEMTLGEGMTFTDKDSRYIKVAFTIHKDESDNLKFKDSVIFIEDTEELAYMMTNEDGIAMQRVEILEMPIIYDETAVQYLTGYTIDDSPYAEITDGLEAGDIVCFYTGTDPRERDYTTNTYENEAAAYVRIVEQITRDTYTFEALGEDDLVDLLKIPDTVPYNVEQLPTGNGTVDINGYDNIARSYLGIEDIPNFAADDLLIFYTGEFSDVMTNFENLENYDKVAFGKVTGYADDNTVNYEIIQYSDIENLIDSDMYISNPVNMEDYISDAEKTELEAAIEQQALESGFTDEAVQVMANNAFQSESVQEKMLEAGFSQEEVRTMAGAGTGSSSRVRYQVEEVSPYVNVLIGDRYENGVGVSLGVSAVLSVSKKLDATRTVSLKIEMNASFEEQIAIDVNIDVSAKWKVIVLKELSVNASFDLKNYTSASVSVKVYTVQDTTMPKWQALRNTTDVSNPLNKVTAETLDKINKLAVKARKFAKTVEEKKEMLEELQGLYDSLPKVNVGGQDYTIEALQEELGMTDVSTEFEDLLEADDYESNKVGMDQLMNKYTEMLNSEAEWIQLLNKPLVEKSFYIKIIEIKFTVSAVISANLNMTAGADLEYEIGKRYCFWLNIFAGTTGSSELDLLDERFGFQFYIMGAAGLRAGAKLDVAVGVISTKIASVGVNVEAGPYVKLYGYFIYIFTKERPMGTTQWEENEETMGAIYVEAGIYVIVNFKASLFGDAVKYEPNLYSGEFPFLKVGADQHPYDFSLDSTTSDLFYVLDSDNNSTNGITMPLPEIYRTMKVMNLKTGVRELKTYEGNCFFARFTNPCFSMDTNTGIISVDRSKAADPDTRYERGYMVLSWKLGKLAFSEYDISITVPIVWTNLSASEMAQKFTASVVVGNDTEGWKKVWNQQYTRIESFDLPSQEEILDLINYDGFTDESGTNLKYDGKGSYRDTEITEINITGDKTFYYEIPLKKYEVAVYDVQSATGSSEIRTYTTTYGNTFVELVGLQSTGANNKTSNIYSSFYKLTYQQQGVTYEFELDTVVDMSFIQKFPRGATVYANYIDDSRIATFEFVGIGDIEPLKVPFRKGDIPTSDDLLSYIKQYGGENVSIVSVTPEVTNSDSSISYMVICKPDSNEPKYTVNFKILPSEYGQETPEIKSAQYLEGSVIFRPSVSSIQDASFDGWYKDEACSQPFDFSNERMPNSDITLYGRVVSKLVNIYFYNGNTLVEKRGLPMGAKFGEMPKVTDLTETQRIDGWYDSSGRAYDSMSTVSTTSDYFLYAKITEKFTVNISADDFSVQTNVYSGYNDEIPYIWKTIVNDKLGNIINKSDARASWRINGAPPETEWNDTGSFLEQTTDFWPSDAGYYDIRITYPGNDDYLPVDIFLENYLIIKKSGIYSIGSGLDKPAISINGNVMDIYYPPNFFNRYDEHSYSTDAMCTANCDIRYMGKDTGMKKWKTEVKELQWNNGESGKMATIDMTDFPYDDCFLDVDYVYIYVFVSFNEGRNYLGGSCPGVTIMHDITRNRAASSTLSLNTFLTGIAEAAESFSVQAENNGSIGYDTYNVDTEGTDDNTSPMVITGNSVKTIPGTSFRATFEVNNNSGIWGLWENINFEETPFELAGYNVGSVFPKNGFTIQRDWSNKNINFVATNGTRTDTVENGDLITLWFWVPDDTEYGTYTIDMKTLQAVNGENTIKPISDTAVTVEIVGPESFTAEIPKITKNLENISYLLSSETPITDLSVSAVVNDGGTLSYQWYENTSDSTEGGQPIEGATDPTFTPLTDEIGPSYYYCVVTNTLETVAGTRTTSVNSLISRVDIIESEKTITFDPNGEGAYIMDVSGDKLTTVNGKIIRAKKAWRDDYTFIGWFTEKEGGEELDLETVHYQDTTYYAHWEYTPEIIDAQKPYVQSNFKPVTANRGDEPGEPFEVSAEVNDGGILSYQWYVNTADSTEGGTPVEGATEKTYQAPTDKVGTFYYYCVVTNTNLSVTGEKTAEAFSETVKVTIFPGFVNITLDGNGGNVEFENIYTNVNGNLPYLPSANRDGYMLSGWSTKKDGSELVTTDTVFLDPVTLYAVWSEDIIAPVITSQPEDVETKVYEKFYIMFNVDFGIQTSGYDVSFQWFVNTEDSNQGGTLIEDFNRSIYEGQIQYACEQYYYCTVTVTDEKLIGNKTASVTTEPAKVTVTSSLTGHIVTVNNGDGDGQYEPGDTVYLYADLPEASKHFTGWTVTSGNVEFDDAGERFTSFVMPDEDVTVTANYENHVYDDDGDCTTEEICSVCSEVVIPAKDSHSFGEWTSNKDGTHSRYCENETCRKSETEACSGGTATYFNKAVCEICGAEYGELIKDTEAPTGEITVAENKWRELLNSITFGLFFKDTQDVEITAYDDSYEQPDYTDDKAAVIGYYLYNGETALTKAELDELEFTAYTGSFRIEPNNMYVIYARITDHAGNITYISSDGIIVSNTVPGIYGIEDGKTYCEAVEVTVSGEFIDSVTVNGVEVTLADGKFTVEPAEGEQKIIVTDMTGETASLTITVNDGHTIEVQNKKEETCTEDGYTGDKVCTACGEIIEKGEVIEKHHNYEYGQCTVCGELDPQYRVGDANMDGKINILDATAIQKYIVKIIDAGPSFSTALADMDGNGKITIYDATKIQTYIAQN